MSAPKSKCLGPDRNAARAWVPGAWSRRQLLQVGTLTVAGTPTALATAAQTGTKAKAQSVILLMMMGGVTQFESLDPKPDAPEGIRGTLDPIDTRLPGVQFAETMPQLASIADRLCVVRSYSHGSNDHFLSQAHALSGRVVTLAQIKTEPNIGSIVSHVQGPRAHLPGYMAIPGHARPGPPPAKLFTGGWLGGGYDPFAIGGEPEIPDFTATPKTENPNPNIEEQWLPPELRQLPEMNIDRLTRRAQLRVLLETQLRNAERRDGYGAMDGHYEHAFELLGSDRIRAAFDVSTEPVKLREQYGRTKIGGRCLLARRLVEAGARFVMVDYGYDHDYGNLWDNHNVPAQLFPHICEMAKRGYHVAGIDRAFAGLISDLETRGLLDSTLVVFHTEFGRTPQINKYGGRDHWGAAGSIFFAGGGTRGGQVIGATDKHGAFPTTRGFSPSDVAATIYSALGIDYHQRVYDAQRRPHFILPEGEPIPGVLV